MSTRFSDTFQLASAFIALAHVGFATLGCDDEGTTSSGPSASSGNNTGAGAMSASSTSGGPGGMGGMGPGPGGAGTYPPGPYGNQVGETLPLLDWEGYVNPAADAVASSQPWVDFGSDGVHASASTHALIHLAGNF
jgi:hypothetical protein